MSTQFNSEEIHSQLSKASQLEVGDIVRITHKVPNRHLGWDNNWVDIMDNAVGQVARITEISHKSGYVLENVIDHPKSGKLGTRTRNFRYPVFCLELVKKAQKVVTVELNEQYTAKIYPGEKIEVGCQTISADTFKEIEKLFNQKSK